MISLEFLRFLNTYGSLHIAENRGMHQLDTDLIYTKHGNTKVSSENSPKINLILIKHENKFINNAKYKYQIYIA